MRRVMFVMAFAFVSASAVAQQPAQSPAQAVRNFVSSADVAALVAKARSERKEGQATVAQPLLRLAPYNVNLEYRTAVGPASVHEHEGEFFYVIDGSGTLVTGGSLVNSNRTNPNNLSGTAIEGGTAQRVAKGDFVMVPEGSPHWFSAIDGTLVLMSVHLPRAAAATR